MLSRVAGLSKNIVVLLTMKELFSNCCSGRSSWSWRECVGGVVGVSVVGEVVVGCDVSGGWLTLL